MPEPPGRTDAVHATCIALDGAGILIRGEAGTGKSTLALLLLDRAALAGLPAGLVGDDRIRLAREDAAVVARPHPALADRIEVRGLGLLRASGAVASAPLRLVVDLVAARPRLPEAAPGTASLLGRPVPRLVLDRAILRTGLGPRLVLDALAACPGVTGNARPAVVAFPPFPEP